MNKIVQGFCPSVRASFALPSTGNVNMQEENVYGAFTSEATPHETTHSKLQAIVWSLEPISYRCTSITFF